MGMEVNFETYSMKVDRVLCRGKSKKTKVSMHSIKGIVGNLTGNPRAPPGIDISMTELGGNVYTDPLGNKSCGG